MQKAENLYHNALVYTVDSSFSKVNSFVTSKGKIIETGDYKNLKDKYEVENEVNLNGKFVYPGFIDAHCHFYWYGIGLQKADLVGTKSFNEVIERLQAYVKQYPDKDWIEGRGWDQNDWEVKEFPVKEQLDTIFPDRPVLLIRVDGHAALVNSKALELAGINKDTKIEGGDIRLENGEPTGILIDNAIEMVRKIIPEITETENRKALKEAQADCFNVGLTGIVDAGLDTTQINLIRRGHEEGWLKMRINAMMSPTEENRNAYMENGGYSDERLQLTGIKLFADGALGSRGACLLENYSDDSGNTGFMLEKADYYRKWAKIAYDNNLQCNTHAIGDSANRFVLDLYADFLESNNDRRWRIEHAQIVHPDDQKKFGDYNVIPSIQATHCTSDMYWADERLGEKRMKFSAYAYKDLLEYAGILAGGSDFPVEDINPLYGFYAAVARQDQQGYPEGGFQPENAINREQALRSTTIWAAHSTFAEKEKGSLEPGKFADFVILDRDIMEVPLEETFNAKVLATYLNDELVYSADLNK